MATTLPVQLFVIAGIPASGTAGRFELLRQPDDPLGGRRLALLFRADGGVGDLFQVRPRRGELFRFFGRVRFFDQPQAGTPVDEEADRGRPERALRRFEIGRRAERLGARFQRPRRRLRAVGDDDLFARRADDQRLLPELLRVPREAGDFSVGRGHAFGPGRPQDEADAADQLFRFGGVAGFEHHRAADVADTGAFDEAARVAEVLAQRFEVDADRFQRRFEFARFELAGHAGFAEAVDTFGEALAEGGGGEAQHRGRRQRFEQLRGVAALHRPFADVGGQVELHLFGAGDDRADQGRVLRFDLDQREERLRFGVDALDRAAEVDVDAPHHVL